MSDKLNLPPAMRDTLHKVAHQGLHRVAGELYSMDNLDLSKVAGYLCERLYATHKRQEKIASGIQALKKLSSSGDVKL